MIKKHIRTITAMLVATTIISGSFTWISSADSGSTLAPSICSGPDIPDPVAVYDFEEEGQYDVVSDGSGKVEVVNDYNSDTQMGKGNVLHVPASGDTDTEVSIPNPFAGMDLSEGTQTTDVRGDNYEADEMGMPIWYEGVTINYWIKTIDDTNSVVINFRNNDRLQYHKDDWRKHVLAVEAKEAYDKSVATGEPIDARFSLGTIETYVDRDGNEYKVYSGSGEYVRYNPEYEEGFMVWDSSYKGGYIPDTNKYEVRHQESDPNLNESWVYVFNIGENYFDAYYEVDWKINDKCKIRQGYTDGFLQLSLDGSIYFIEDDGSGVNENPWVYAPKNEFNIRNNFRMTGSETLTDSLSSENEIEKWHMVTIVIQNDWIDYYLDGELYEDMLDEFSFYGGPLSAMVGGVKSFNAGFGPRAPLSRGTSARTDYLSGNRAGSLLTEWLSLENTTVSVGGVNSLAIRDNYSERVAEFYIDDISFYDTVLDEDQTWELYESGRYEIENYGTFNPDAVATPSPDSPVIQVGDSVAREKEVISVPVEIKNNPGITAVTLSVDYDSDVMSLKSVTNNNLLTGAMYTTSASIDENPYKMIWVVGTSDIKSNGTLATLEFEIKEGAEAGDYPISVSYEEDDVYDTTFENVFFYTVDGTVTIKDIMPGDVNADGKINTKDAALLLQYFVAIVDSIDEEVADVNNDGKVNTKDASMILQYCAGWDVILK